MPKGYTVDDILDEIKRKKEKGQGAKPTLQREQERATTKSAPAVRQSTTEKPEEEAPKKDFFAKRESGEPLHREAGAPTYSPASHGGEPMTTRTIKIDDTLSQYFGNTSQGWINQKKQNKEHPVEATAPHTEPPHHTEPPRHSEETYEKPVNYRPRHLFENEKPTGNNSTEEKEDSTFLPKEKEAPTIKPPAPERGFNIVPPKADIPEEKKAPLTASSNPELYKEFSEQRQDRVNKFMAAVREPTEQDIPVLKSKKEENKTKVKFSEEESNSEIAKSIMAEGSYEEDEPEDYCEPSQAKAVMKELSSERLGLILRLGITGILFVAALLLAIFPLFGFNLPAPFNYSQENIVYPITLLGTVCVAALISNATVGGGLISLLKFKANNDSFSAIAVIGACILGVTFILSPDAMAKGGENLYFPLAILALAFNTVGKLFMIDRIIENFAVLTGESDEKKSSLLPVHDKELAKELTGQMDEVPRFCCSARAEFFSSFMDLSYRDDATAGLAKIVAPIALLASILMGVISFFFTSDIPTSLVGLSGALIIVCPLASTIAGNFPVLRTCRALNKEGTMMAGGYTAETFAEADSVLMDIDELFPEGSITLHGLKTFAQGRIDEAILDAASVICSTKSTISSIFLNVVQGERKLLKPVDTIVYEDGMGLSAWVNSKRVLIGNRQLMENHGVAIPSRDYEQKYVGGGRDILYLSNSGTLTSMFVISYHADPKVKQSLDIFASRGVKLVINCTDPNITTEKLNDLFGYPEEQLKILSSKYQPQCNELTKEREKAPAAAVYDGNLTHLSNILSASGSIRQACFLSVLLEIVGIVLGFIMITFFLFTGSIASLGLLPLLGYQLFWVAAVFLVAAIRKPL